MALLLYPSAILEKYKPKSLVFTEEEILTLFSEYSHVRTVRIPSILNTWCVYGANTKDDASNFNRIASDIIEYPVYSHMLFIHDSELNPDWNVTDNILYKGYSEFVVSVKNKIDETSSNIIKELESMNEYQEKIDFLPNIVNVGQTPDKRLLFLFNPDDQTKEFYNNEEFYLFSQKVYEYIIHNKQKKHPFTIYADSRAVIIIDENKVKSFLTSLLEKFKTKEEYEICENITKIMDSWSKSNSNKLSKKRKTKSSEE